MLGALRAFRGPWRTCVLSDNRDNVARLGHMRMVAVADPRRKERGRSWLRVANMQAPPRLRCADD